MKEGLIHKALGENWEKLQDPLKAHHQANPSVDIGHLDIEFPHWMTPYLRLLQRCGALLARAGTQVPTRVEKNLAGECQHWRRSMRFPDGSVVKFDSFWVSGEGNRLTEYVNPAMGLEMTVHVHGEELHFEGRRFILKLGRIIIGLPEWLILGHTTIVERALGMNAFAMDFRLTHPLFGQVFRYSGTFVTERRPI